jgi:SAM-dependent methyltransferase
LWNRGKKRREKKRKEKKRKEKRDKSIKPQTLKERRAGPRRTKGVGSLRITNGKREKRKYHLTTKVTKETQRGKEKGIERRALKYKGHDPQRTKGVPSKNKGRGVTKATQRMRKRELREKIMQSQHYKGLIAEWYDEWLKERTDDIDYYSEFFKGFDGRVLELACGTGRLLLPIAEGGVTIDGLDSSEDMLGVLRSKAENLGLNGIELHNRSMEDFSLATQYDAVFVASGSFQLLTVDEQALNSLECIRRCLSDTGFLVLDIFVPWGEIIMQKCASYQVTRDVSRPDGKRSIVHERFSISIPKQIKYGTYRYEFYDQKQLTQCILDDLSIRWYWKDEFMNLLKRAHFSKIDVLTQSALYDEGTSFVFKAYK